MRNVSRDEQHAIGKALERTRKANLSFRMDLALLPATPLNRSMNQGSIRRGATPVRAPTVGVVPERLSCAFEVSYIGAKRVVTVFNGRNRYATGREVLAARLLADHGECVLHGRNGKCIGVLRDPLIAERPPVTGRRVQWSRNPADTVEGERRMLASVSPAQRRIKMARHAGSQSPTYSPHQCPNDCRGLRDGQPWALAKGAVPPTEHEHHPVCKYAPAWAATLAPAETSEVLYDLELSTVARPAEPSEVQEAALAEKTTGMRQVTVAGRVYAVLSAVDAKRASLEARGEAPDAIDRAISTGSDIDFSGEDTGPDLDPDIDAQLDGESDTADLVRAPVITTGPSTEADRESWPTLDATGYSSVAEQNRKRAEVTARDYLARSPNPGPHGA